jgi:hypothetical protein
LVVSKYLLLENEREEQWHESPHLTTFARKNLVHQFRAEREDDRNILRRAIRQHKQAVKRLDRKLAALSPEVSLPVGAHAHAIEPRQETESATDGSIGMFAAARQVHLMQRTSQRLGMKERQRQHSAKLASVPMYVCEDCGEKVHESKR